MDAKTGTVFLKILFQEKRIDTSDIEKAIEIAGSKSPSASFDAAGLHARSTGKDQMTSLAFAKGTRWLAMIRRNEGQQAFDAAVAELRQSAGGTP